MRLLSDNRPIGVFDSGLGGLTVVRELQKIMPQESLVYFGDTGRVPYGTKSEETIKLYTRQDIEFLLSQNVKAIIAACGTVSSVALPFLQNTQVSVTGVVEPSVLSAVSRTKNGKIGVIGTSATVKSNAYGVMIKDILKGSEVYSVACPMFVPLVEAGWISRNDEVTLATARRYLLPLKEKGVDTLILGCTHFPLLSDIIGDVMGDNVTLIDTGFETAHYVLQMLKKDNMTSEENNEGVNRYFVSDRVNDFSSLAAILLGKDISDGTQLVRVDSL